MYIQTDIVIVGSGIAALQAARKLSTRYNVHIITKGELTRSSSYIAQGGVAAVISDQDHFQLHIEDTLTAGEGHHDTPNVSTLVSYGAHVVNSLLTQGFKADRQLDGTLSLGLEGAHCRNRIVHAGGDATGKHLINYLLNDLPANVTVHEHELAYELMLNSDGECCGVYVRCAEGLKTYRASYVIIASGGAGALFETTSNWPSNVGDGIALAYLAGAAVTDMEFMQFHPSLLYVNGQGVGLISEAVRGAGATFVDATGKRIMEGIHPLGDLAPRHITAFQMYQERAQGKDVFLNISAVEDFATRFPTITALCDHYQIDWQCGLLPIAPGSHFLMGGIVATAHGETTVPRLYAVGEAACTGVHGANRLASNSLLEGIAFSDLLAEKLLLEGSEQTNFIVQKQFTPIVQQELFSKNELRQMMMAHVGIVRDGRALHKLAERLPALDFKPSLHSLSTEQLELTLMHIVAALMATAALVRTESRGAHIRTDYPNRVEKWRKQWIILQQGQWNVRNSLYEHNQTEKYAHAIF